MAEVLRGCHLKFVCLFFTLYKGGNQILWYKLWEASNCGDWFIDGSVDGFSEDIHSWFNYSFNFWFKQTVGILESTG